MKGTNEISEEILDLWDQIRYSAFSVQAQKILHEIKGQDTTGYCILLGLIFNVAVFQNKELPEEVRGKDPEAFVVTTIAPLLPPDITETRDFGKAWRLAAYKLHLEGTYKKIVELCQKKENPVCAGL